jgi:nitrate/nitrite-specific signal transduction histidine kinase
MFASIRAKLSTVFVSFLLLVAASVMATFLTIETQTADALVINLAGRQRMLTQKMTKAVLGIARDPASSYQAELEETVRLFDRTLAALQDGGNVRYDDTIVTLPATTNAAIRAQLDTVAGLWSQFHAHIEVVQTTSPPSPSFDRAVLGVESLSLVILQEMDRAVQLYEAAAGAKLAHLRTIQALFFITAVGLLVAGYLTIQRTLVIPLSGLEEATQRIAAGDLRTTLGAMPVASSEIRALSHSFEEMRHELAVSQRALERKANELEMRVEQRTQQLAALFEISADISSRLEIDDVLKSIVDKTCALTGGEVAVLCLFDAAAECLNVAATSGAEEAFIVLPPATIDGVTVQSLENRFSHGDCKCPLLHPEFRRSHLEVPLHLGNRTFGMLCVGHRQDAHFEGEETRLLSLLADAGAVALENARSVVQAEDAATLAERERIVVEIHDGLAQTLSYLNMRLHVIEDLIAEKDLSEVPDHLALMRHTAEKAAREVRRLMADLRADAEASLTLQASLRQALNDFGDEHQIEIDFQAEVETPIQESPQVQEQVLRVVLEALTNVRKHADVPRATVTLVQHDTRAVVRIQDDGPGFDANASTDGGHHFGLRVMATRAEWIGGELAIESTPGQGTAVTLRWSLPGP